jgi:hypothetical protein
LIGKVGIDRVSSMWEDLLIIYQKNPMTSPVSITLYVPRPEMLITLRAVSCPSGSRDTLVGYQRLRVGYQRLHVGHHRQ